MSAHGTATDAGCSIGPIIDGERAASATHALAAMPGGSVDASGSAGAQEVVSAPARTMRVLGGGGHSHVLLRCDRGDLVCLEVPGGIGLPISVTVGGEVMADAFDSQQVTVGGGQITTRRWEVTVTRWHDDRIVLDPGELDGRRVARIGVALTRRARPQEPEAVWERAEAFRGALTRAPGSALRDAAGALIGLGLGATPAGDDMVAAATATLAAASSHPGAGHGAEERLDILAAVIRRRGADTTPLSAALLRGATEGRAIPALRRFVSSLADPGDLDADLDSLVAVGHSSGYFLAAGALAAADALNGAAGTSTRHAPDRQRA